MNTDKKNCFSCTPELDELTEKVIGAVHEVANTLGVGFLEKVYQRALVQELRARGLKADAEVPMDVFYKYECVGNYFVDVVVEEQLLVELKCVSELRPEHFAQCMNYLKACAQPLCLLVNFQSTRVQCKRVVNQ